MTASGPSAAGPSPPVRTATAPDDARRWFALVAALIVLYVVLDAIAQVLPPHYSPIRQAESDLAVGPYGAIMTANFVVRGLLTLVFLAAFARTVAAEGVSWREYRSAYAAFLVWGIGAFLLAAFPTDVPATPISWHGWIHGVVAIPVFIGGALGTYWFASRFDRAPILRAAEPWALVLAVLSILLLVVELFGGLFDQRISDRVGGLLERLFLGAVLLWIFLVSVYLARDRRPRGARTA